MAQAPSHVHPTVPRALSPSLLQGAVPPHHPVLQREDFVVGKDLPAREDFPELSNSQALPLHGESWVMGH